MGEEDNKLLEEVRESSSGTQIVETASDFFAWRPGEATGSMRLLQSPAVVAIN